jgi:hypothetical protein
MTTIYTGWDATTSSKRKLPAGPSGIRFEQDNPAGTRHAISAPDATQALCGAAIAVPTPTPFPGSLSEAIYPVCDACGTLMGE